MTRLHVDPVFFFEDPELLAERRHGWTRDSQKQVQLIVNQIERAGQFGLPVALQRNVEFVVLGRSH